MTIPTRIEHLGLTLDFEFAGAVDLTPVLDDVTRARATLEQGDGPGREFLGWLDLPLEIDDALLGRLESEAATIREAEALVVVGIGGSYLGARAVLEALRPPLAPGLEVLFAGHHLDAAWHEALLARLAGRRYAVNVISKSGTTTEPGLAFRLLWLDLKRRFAPADLKRLVFATTDAKKGSLRKLADAEGLVTHVIPDDVGGRFSVLSPVGLLPLAAAGIDIRGLVEGARAMRAHLRARGADSPETSLAVAYAAFRTAAYRAGKKLDVLAAYDPRLALLGEWWKQLYGESEGKGGRALWPASMNLTTDLHSLGQWLQDGERTVIETVIDIEEGAKLTIPALGADDDGLEYLAGRELHEVNRVALRATLEAHRDGGVPCLRLGVPRLDARTLGGLLYLFEYACGLSAYALGVNPFDQPGVEAYKRNMFRLLGKPGC